MRDDKYFTCVFEGDLRKFDGNPFHVDTLFGRPVATGLGNAFDEWQPIETAPKEAVPILVAYDSGDVELVEDSSHYDWQPYVGSDLCDTPAYWMPVPKPPSVA